MRMIKLRTRTKMVHESKLVKICGYIGLLTSMFLFHNYEEKILPLFFFSWSVLVYNGYATISNADLTIKSDGIIYSSRKERKEFSCNEIQSIVLRYPKGDEVNIFDHELSVTANNETVKYYTYLSEKNMRQFWLIIKEMKMHNPELQTDVIGG